MKNTWNVELLSGCEDLQPEELGVISGGESLWYWAGYIGGLFVYAIGNASGNQGSGQRLMNAALG